MKRVLALVAFAAIFLFLAGCATTETPPAMGSGILKGKITIGPLCPVEPCRPAPNMSAVYGNMRVNVYEKSSGAPVAQTTVNASGEYLIRLKGGSYLVDVTDAQGKEFGIGKSQPKEAEIPSGAAAVQTTVLDIDIDTGIR